MVFKRLLFSSALLIAPLLIAPWALADDQALNAEFLQYLVEFSDDQGNTLDPELIAIAEDQRNAAKDSDSAATSVASTSDFNASAASTSTARTEPPPATPATAGNAFSQGE